MVSGLEHDGISAITELTMVATAANLVENVIHNLLSAALVWVDNLDVMLVPMRRIWLSSHPNDGAKK